ncbi:hypothetical protein [Collinsella sp. An2]|uniref:hypothetical protein n=1 Tax=Collinsella sp. An2 TaxID=1965585 RepID=UPI000B3872D0|nr:hypothetical protein [Collinsella sp. An2]OUP10484.1 hypothetical protein B5F33_02645 [Collinsella sp. An2]
MNKDQSACSGVAAEPWSSRQTCFSGGHNMDGADALQAPDALELAISHAFWEARDLLNRDGALMPFTVLCTAGGMEVADHPAATSDEVYEAVKNLLARVDPDAYVLCYDGTLNADGCTTDAVVCEAARRTDAEAHLLALPYTIGDNGYTFENACVTVGTTRQLQWRPASPASTFGVLSAAALLIA